MKKYFILLLIVNSVISFSQNEVKKDGYNIFYYPNGKINSEGMIKNAKPEGYWRTYYVTGVLKSEGKYTNNLLDSIWVFFNQVGDTIEKINYIYGKKNGYYYKYSYDNVKAS